MKSFEAIREDLRNIRYYYSRKEQMSATAKIVGESNVLKTVNEYNEIVCQAPPKLYELYFCMYVENKTQESAAEEFGYAREHVTILDIRLLNRVYRKNRLYLCKQERW